MKTEYEAILEESRGKSEFIKRQMKYLGKFNIKNFDHVVADFHDEVFQEIHCMECGNCCRTVGPRLTETEIKKVTKAIGANQKTFVRETLVRDEELGWMCKSMPCPFIGEDNACSVYDVRPKACEEYPYTTGRAIQRALGRLAWNTEFCPAAYKIALKIIDRYAKGTDL